MTRFALTAATRLLYDGSNLRLVEQRGDEVDWSCDRHARRFTFTHSEMAELIRTGQASLPIAETTASPQPLEDPEQVEPDRRREAERRFAYVIDMHEAGLATRPPKEKVESQIRKTALRLDDPLPPEIWTVKRWMKKAGEKPTWLRLLDGTPAKGNRGLRITEDQRAVIERQIDERYMRRPPISVEAFLPFVRDAIRRSNLERPSDDQLEHASRDAVLSVISLREPRAVHAARHGEPAARDKFDRVTTQKDPDAPLDRIEIDHTKADLFVVSDVDGLPIGRPTIGFAIDRCTRMPFGLYVGFEPESVLSVMQILKNGIFPKTYVTEKIESGEWDLKHDWPVWGMPRGLVFDRGMAGLSADLRAAASELGIRDVTFVAARTGQQKGAVERFFRTQNQKLLHAQRGTTYSNVVMRGDYDSAKNAVLPFSDFLKMSHRFLIDIYAHDKHGGLGGEMPIRAWQRLIDRHPSDPLVPMADMIHLFTRTETRTLRREGIRFKSIFYNSETLDAERLTADFAKVCPDRNVLIRYDPADLHQVWVRLPHRTDRYLAVPADTAWSDYAEGRSIWEHGQIRDHHRQTVGGEFDADAAAEARVALAADLDKADAKRRSAKSRARKARHDGVGRTSPAGSDHSTSPKGSAAKTAQSTVSRQRPANDADAQIDNKPPPSRGASAPSGGRRNGLLRHKSTGKP